VIGSASDRERFLGEASRVLAQSLDYQRTLSTVARLAVPRIADWCTIDLVTGAGTLARAAIVHRHATQQQLLASLAHCPPPHHARAGAPDVVRNGVTEYVPRVSESLLQQREPDHERRSLLRRLELNSMICAPLVARHRTLGAITLFTQSGRDLMPDDVPTAEGLARRAAVAIDNARLYEEARQALRAREEILAVVTHDLRTPLSAIIANAALLTSVECIEPNPDRIRHRGETIARAAHHMSRLVRDLADLAQIQAGRLGIERTLEDPVDIIREVVAALQPVVTRNQGTLHARTQAGLPGLMLDRDRLRQVVANLVGNAANAGASAITVGAAAEGSDVVFQVADNGPGIPPEDLPRMFDRYWRRQGTRYAGSGLGLQISHGIVEAHGGRMWVESTVGEGSTFFFSIPRP
jgi:signal transduction histidine kinase